MEKTHELCNYFIVEIQKRKEKYQNNDLNTRGSLSIDDTNGVGNTSDEM